MEIIIICAACIITAGLCHLVYRLYKWFKKRKKIVKVCLFIGDKSV